MDGSRRRRHRSAEEARSDSARFHWYAWWRAARFAAHFGTRDRPTPEHFPAPLAETTISLPTQS
jgi:hypothetical protein